MSLSHIFLRQYFSVRNLFIIFFLLFCLIDVDDHFDTPELTDEGDFDDNNGDVGNGAEIEQVK